MTIAKSIKVALIRKDLEQRELAKMINITSTTVSSWCTGKTRPSVSNEHKIANALGYTHTYLISLGVDK